MARVWRGESNPRLTEVQCSDLFGSSIAREFGRLNPLLRGVGCVQSVACPKLVSRNELRVRLGSEDGSA